MDVELVLWGYIQGHTHKEIPGCSNTVNTSSSVHHYQWIIISASASVHQHHFWYPWTILFSKIYHLFGLSGTSSYAVFVYFVFVFFVFARLTHGNIIFDMLEQSSFQKYTTCWVFLALRHMLYLCICVFCICIFCICVFDTWEYYFWYPWTILFSKIYHMLGLSSTSSYAIFAYLCILYLYFLYLRV